MRRPSFVALAMLLLLAGVESPAAHAQNGAGPNLVPNPAPRLAPRRIPHLRMRLDEDAPDRPPLAIDRQTLKEIETAGDLIGKQQFSEALHHLQHVVDKAEDSWIEVPGPHGTTFESAKRLAAERIGNLPAQARESYETEYGQVARQLLDDASRHGNSEQLAEVVSRYFHTRAGYKAAYALGNRLFDASMPLPAASQFERLRRSPGGAAFEPMLSLKEAFCWLRVGSPEKASAVLSEMKKRSGGASVTIGGKKGKIPDGGEVTQWLAGLIGPTGQSAPKTVAPRDWTLPGGSPDRNASSSDALPIGEAAWKQSLIRDRDLGVKDRFGDIETALDEYRNALSESDSLAIPSGAPLVIGNTVVFRTFARLRAVDLRTGDRLWDFAERDRLYSILAAARYQTRRTNRLPISVESTPQDEIQLFLNSRAFRDMTYAGLSSDGERIFAVLDGGFLGLDENQRSEQSDSLAARNHNVLCAVDLATGRLLWELGGGRSDRNRDLAGTFFLGCGLPMNSALYALGELDGDISLFKLDPATGKRIYTQRLATPLGRLANYPLRRLAGGSPSAAAGLIICPITGGAVTAFDPAARTLAWEYRYPVNKTGDPRNWADVPLDTGSDESSRWLDSAPLIADGAVLLTPRDSDELHCLNLADGTLRWKQQRGNRLFLAGASDGVVYAVGRAGMEALRLKDGNDAWSQPIELGSPAGRGYRTGNFYHLPLSTRELATIDLHRGRVVTRTRFDKDVQPGNLVSAEGAVLMESAALLQGFRPTAELEASIAAALERKPDDASALAARGELRLERGQTDAGLDDLTHSLRVRADSRIQSIAVATVLESLRFDFAGSRALAERFGPEITDTAQRVEFHRLMAAGLAREGHLEEALKHELELLQDESLASALLPVGESVKVQLSQLLAPELAELFAKADAEKQARLSKAIEKWTAHLADEGHIDQLRRAIDAFHNLPVELDARRTLLAKLAATDHAELVRQLTHLRKSPDAKVAGNATARLARLFIDRHRPEESLDLLAELGERFRAVTCLDGKTGSALANAWFAEPGVKTARVRQAPWPGSSWTVKSVPYERPLAEQAIPIPVEQHAGSFYRHWRFESRNAGDRGFTLAAIDAAGNERWQLELTSNNLGLSALGDAPLTIRVQGPLIEVALRRRIIILDGLDGTQPPKILWSRALFDPHWSATNQMRTEIGLIGHLAGDRVFYQFGSALCAADLITGRTLWERRNIPFPFSLEGDSEYVIALSRNDPMDPFGLVLSASSGAEFFGGAFNVQGPLTQAEWQGRRVLTTSFTPRQVTCARSDLVARKTEWTHTFPLPAWPLPIDDEQFAVLEPGPKLRIYSTAKGKKLLETTFDTSLNSPQLAIRRVGNRYIVIRQTVAFRIAPGDPRRPVIDKTGIWAINADTGEVAWRAPAPPPQVLVDLPVQSPVLVLLRPLSRFEAVRAANLATTISILDVKTGKSIYEGREATSADRINVRLDPDAHAVIVTTDKHRLEVTAKNAE